MRRSAQFPPFLLALFILFVLLALLASPPSSHADEPDLWERPALIGASASSGFTMVELFGGPRTDTLGLGTNLTALIKAKHGAIADHSEPQFFRNAPTYGDKKTKQALAEKPTVVFAPDFLFWFVYGNINEGLRMFSLEIGLEYLDRFTCPVVVGNIPDATEATGLMLRKEQVPSAKTLAKANQRIQDWADKRENKVAVIGLNAFMAQSMADKELRLRHRAFPAGTTRELFQVDKLHPNQAGARVFALALLEALQDEVPFPDADVDWHQPLPKLASEKAAEAEVPTPTPAEK